MTPERMAELVARWVRLYTRELPAPIAERRIEEIGADVQDHIAHERSRGTGDRRIALSILSRMVRGVAADASWRRTIARSSTARRSTRRSLVRVGLATVAILLVPLAGMAFGDEVAWSVGDFVFAATVLAGTGLVLELAVRNPRRNAYRIATAAIAVAAIVLGKADDAPGLVLFGCLLALGTVGLAFRTARRSG